MIVFKRSLLVVTFILLFSSLTARAQWLVERQVYTGTITADAPRVTYPLLLRAGQALLASVDATSGDLDTMLMLYAPNQTLVVANDDRTYGDLNSLLGYRAPLTGTYTLEVTRYDLGDSTGDFQLEIVYGGEDILTLLDSVRGVQLSGVKRMVESPNFIVHYTLTGDDRVIAPYADRVLQTAEAAYDIEINQMGWSPPPSDGAFGGDGRLDIYIESIDALGYASGDFIVGDNPNSPEIETNASAGFIQVSRDMPFDIMRATIAHELHHAIQSGMDAREPHGWYYETTSSYIETIVFPEDEDASRYVAYNFEYPELCFGTQSDGGELQYGEWTFFTHLTDQYGASFVHDLWRNLITFDGFAALKETLDVYEGRSLPDEIALYRARNLALDYDLAPDFGATVYIEDVISEPGLWTPFGEGVQELGANYYQVDLPPDQYIINLGGDGGVLDIYGLGVYDDQVTVLRLPRGATINSDNYDFFYLMVFNPLHDEDVDDCTYVTYTLDIIAAQGASAFPIWNWDARYFTPPG